MRTLSLRTSFAPLLAGFICVFLGTYDNTAIAVVLPTIADDLGLDLQIAQWTNLAPMIMSAALLLVMGNLADRIGHRRVLYAGLATFFVAALMAALSVGFAMLLVSRFLTGIALAACYTVGPAFTIRSFIPGRRARALSVVGITTSIGLVSGPLVGGYLGETFGWRTLFWAPLAILVLVMAVIWLGARMRLFERLWETPQRLERKFDYRGASLMLFWQGPLLLAITLGNDRGWLSPEILAAAALGAVVLYFFVRVQLNAAHPTLDFRLFKLRDFRLPVLAAALGFTVVIINFLLLPFYMSLVLGMSAFAIGIVAAISPAMMSFMAPLGALWAERNSPRHPASAGLALLVVGTVLMLLLLRADSSVWLLVGLLALTGIGLGTFEWTINSSIVGSLPRSMLGTSAGILATARTFGFSLGQSVWGLVFTLAVTSRSGGSLALEAPPEDLMFGLRACFAIGAVVALLAFALAFAQRDNPPPATEADILALRPRSGKERRPARS